VADVESAEEGRHLVVRARDGEFIYPLVDNYLRSANARVLSIIVEAGRLDEVFQRLTQPQAGLHSTYGEAVQ